jgi:CrcB protein
MTKILLIMLGGGAGAVCRYSLTLIAAKYIGSRFPWGTLLANLVGCLLIGIAFALAERSVLLSPSARLFFMTGFLGGLTTFSSFALETMNAHRAGVHLVGVANFLVNNLGGALLVLLGIWLTHWILDKGASHVA